MKAASTPAMVKAIAAQDVREALAPLDLPGRVEVVMAVLVEHGRATGDARLFCALVQQAMRERLGAQ